MNIASRLRSVWNGVARRKRMEKDMDSEMRFHMSAYTEDLVRDGVAREEAERRARVEFGHLEPLKEECRQARGLRLIDETNQDIRYATRMLWKSPGFTLLAVFTLALGIGANTAIFSIVNAWVLKPLPYPHADRLFSLHSFDTKRGTPGSTSVADLSDWRRQSQAFEQIAAWISPMFTILEGDEPRSVQGARVNAEFFEMLGVSPQLGRNFAPEDDRPGAAPVAMISNEMWRTSYGASRALIGEVISIDGRKATIIGVLPASFHLPLLGLAKVWMPLAFSEQELKNRQTRYLDVIARTKPGIGLKSASDHMKTLAWRLGQVYPATNANRSVQLVPLRDEIGKNSGSEQAMIAFWLVVCVLLIACTNVANLIVSRAAGRQKEMAVRLAIGAGRMRLYRQLLTENILLFLMAGALSVLFAAWGTNWVARSIPTDVRQYLPNAGVLHVDVDTLLYTLAVGLAAGILFGFAPAFHCRRLDVSDGLKQSATNLSASAAGQRLKNALIVFEIALSLVVLVASGLLTKGLVKMYASDPGFQASGLAAAQLVLSDQYDRKRAQQFYVDVLDLLRREPGIRAAAAEMLVPYGKHDNLSRYAPDGREGPGQSFARLDIITPGYLSTLGIPLRRGRDIQDSDLAEAPTVALINETMARIAWPNTDPVGRAIRYGGTLRGTATVIGVVKDTKGQNETDTPEPQMYIPYRQMTARSMGLIVRVAPGFENAPGVLRKAVNSLDRGMAVGDVQTMDQLMVSIRTPFRIMGQVTMFFGGLSLFLAALGIYGVISSSVAARGREFGIRSALGAAARDILALVVGQGMRLVAIGMAIGLACALAMTRFLTSVLYQVSPTDTSTFLLISILLVAVATAATYFPARRASAVAPNIALRDE